MGPGQCGGALPDGATLPARPGVHVLTATRVGTRAHASRAQSCTAWVDCVALGTGGTLGSVLAGRQQQPERRRSHLGRVGATVAQLGLKPSFENGPCSFLRGGFRSVWFSEFPCRMCR